MHATTSHPLRISLAHLRQNSQLQKPKFLHTKRSTESMRYSNEFLRRFISIDFHRQMILYWHRSVFSSQFLACFCILNALIIINKFKEVAKYACCSSRTETLWMHFTSFPLRTNNSHEYEFDYVCTVLCAVVMIVPMVHTCTILAWIVFILCLSQNSHILVASSSPCVHIRTIDAESTCEFVLFLTSFYDILKLQFLNEWDAGNWQSREHEGYRNEEIKKRKKRLHRRTSRENE